MTPAERKFSDVEGDLTRAHCLVRVLREITDGDLNNADKALWGGVYIIACEAETALDAAVDVWEEAHDKIDRPA